MLEEHGVEHRYREYRQNPLSVAELQAVFRKLGRSPGELLRRRDKAFRKLQLSGDESDEHLIELMAAHPTLLERPIGVSGDRAVVGRPPESLLALAKPPRKP